MDVRQVFTHYERQEGEAEGVFRLCPSCATVLAMEERGGALRPVCPACGFVQYRNPAPAVSVIILEGERVLLGQRRNEPRAGAWAAPSGYLEYEDDFLSAVVREAKEETGLDVQPCEIINVASSFVSPRFHFLTVYVTARVVGGSVHAADDLEAVTWFPVHGPLPEMGFAEDNHAINLVARGIRGLPVQAGRE